MRPIEDTPWVPVEAKPDCTLAAADARDRGEELREGGRDDPPVQQREARAATRMQRRADAGEHLLGFAIRHSRHDRQDVHDQPPQDQLPAHHGHVRIQGLRHQHLPDDLLRRTAGRVRKPHPRWVHSAVAAALPAQREGAQREGLRRQQLLLRTHPHGVLLPHHGRPRGTRRFRRENRGYRVYAASSDEGAGGFVHQLRQHRWAFFS